MLPPADGDTWVGLTDGPLPLEQAASWAVRPDCGAVVTFSGTARNHSVGRPGVWRLEYEAYESQVVPRLQALVSATRERFPTVGRLVLLHRIGVVDVGESSVVVVASAPHRGEAFDAARYGIDTLKATIPIWKRESWDGGESWALEAQHITDADGRDADGVEAGAVSNLAYLGLAVGLSVLGLLVLWLVRRRPHSMEAGMEAFNRELQALAPPDAQVKRQETHVDQVSPAPIRPRPTGPPPGRRQGSRRSRGSAADGGPRRRREPPGVEPD